MSAAADRPKGSGRSPELVRGRARAAAIVLGLFALLAVGLWNLPRQDAPLPAIARQAMTRSLTEFRSTEPVSAIVYGFRATDTFGETFLLLAAVISVLVLTRGRETRRGFIGEERAGARERREEERAEHQDHRDHTDTEEQVARVADQAETGRPSASAPELPDDEPLGSPAPERAPAMTVVTRSALRVVLPLLATAGCYLVIQGYSPGGGFPAGGVVLGVVLLLYAGFGYRSVAPVVRPGVVEVVELAGALAIVAVLVLGLPLAGSFAANWIPLAPEQTLRSGGILQPMNLSEFVEVGTGLVLVVFAVLGMRREWTDDDPPQREGGR
jgi:multicomponent Na+:H+ antiporter subunit B